MNYKPAACSRFVCYSRMVLSIQIAMKIAYYMRNASKLDAIANLGKVGK